jgi:MFS family permease
MLTVAEPIRRGFARVPAGLERNGLSLGQVMSAMARRSTVYGPIIGAVAVLSVLGYGYLNWYPTFLSRTFGLPIRTVGLVFGPIYMVFGTLGTLTGAWLSEYLSRRAYRDANPRVIMLVAIALLLPAALGPLMPNAVLALAAAAPTVLLLNAFFGAAMAAVQLVTPNEMRALVSAVFLLVSTLIGLGIGTSLVATLTDFVFRNDGSLRYSLAIVGAVACPVAALIVRGGLVSYRTALDEAASWT